MGKRNARARQLSNAHKIQAEKHNNVSFSQHLTTTNLESINYDNFETKSFAEKLREKFIENIRMLPINEVKAAYNLFQNMKYQKEKN